MRKGISVAALLLALTSSAYAGDMPNGSPTPPPQPAQTAQEPTTDGDMPNGIRQNDVADDLMQIALDLLVVLPSLY